MLTSSMSSFSNRPSKLLNTVSFTLRCPQHSCNKILFVDVVTEVNTLLFRWLFVCLLRQSHIWHMVSQWLILAYVMGLLASIWHYKTTISASQWCSHSQYEQEPPLLYYEGTPVQCHFQQGRHSLSVHTMNTFGLWRDNVAPNPISIFGVGHGRGVFIRVFVSPQCSECVVFCIPV